MGTDVDPYAALGVPPTATQAEIDTAFRRRQLLLHPDRMASRSEAEQEAAAELLRASADAYAVIGNPRRRALHDAEARSKHTEPAPPPSPHGPPWPPAVRQPQLADGPAPTIPASSVNGDDEAADVERTTPSQSDRTRRPRRDDPSARRILAVLAIGLFVVGPIAEQLAMRFLPLSSYNFRWVFGFASTVGFLVVALKRTLQAHSSGYTLPTTGTGGGTGSSVRYRVDDNYTPEPPFANRKVGRITAAEYGRRAERERQEAAERAHWERVERETVRARREAERYHREQSARQARLDDERRREYNRTHPWGHR